MDEQQIKEKITNEFYWFHKHPELSFKEYNTTSRIRQDLEKAGIHILHLPLETGLVAEFGSGRHPITAIRCDIDALPVTEEADVAYRSGQPGCMHACGHDFRISAILGAAYLLKQREKDINGTIRVIFQPGEEGPSGALKIIETGIIDDVDAIFGMHCTRCWKLARWDLLMVRPWQLSMRSKLYLKGKACMQRIPTRGLILLLQRRLLLEQYRLSSAAIWIPLQRTWSV